MDHKVEKALFLAVKNGDEKAFEEIFHRYYGNLCVFATKITKDDAAAEEIVQDFFVNLWEKREQLKIQTSVKNYVVRSVKNRCINFIKHNKIKQTHEKNIELEQNVPRDDTFFEIDLSQKIEESINSLPEKRQEIFRLSREEGLKYREIAEKLDISIKTVETQIGLAIKTLHEKLEHYINF